MTVEELLEQLKREKERFGKVWQPPCTEAQINALRQAAQQKLNAELPEQYIRFLRRTNGCNWDGLFIYSAQASEDFEQDFVKMNLYYRDVDYFNDLLVFGDSDMDIYVYHISKGEYQMRDRVPAENISQRYASFDEMMSAALSSRLTVATS